MIAKYALVVVALATTAGGCSIYPLPEDATGSATIDIVTNFRCQARRAVRQAFLNDLDNRLATENVTRRYRGAQLASELGKSNGRVRWDELEIGQFVGTARKVLDYYGTTQITYEFSLQTTEGNKQGASIDLLRKFARRADTIGIGFTEDRTRDVSRIFTLHDSFIHLATKVSDKYCNQHPSVNFVFPSTGYLPVEELIRTYVYLNEWGRLDQAEGASKSPALEGTETGPATRQIADTITFTTNLQATNNPTIKYNPDGFGFFASGLGFTNENSRKDLHKVIVTLTTTDKPDGKGDFVAVTIPKDKLRQTGDNAISDVRYKNFQDNVATIARTVSNGGVPGL